MAGASPAHADDAAEAASDATGTDRIIVTGALPDSYVVDNQSTSTRLDLSMRETPQAVAVISRAQIEDFNLDSLNDLLRMTNGVNVEAAESDRTYYNARGFDIVNFQFDGIGQPLAEGIQIGSVDTATFERVEVVRGATGLLSLTGNPSAAVNFIRKRPTSETGGYASLSYGSYDTVRGDVDVNTVLTENGHLRARFVGAYENGGSNLDFYQNSRLTLYGVVSADLGPDTVATVGYSWQESDPKGVTWGGVPFLDADGNQLTYSRSTTTAQPWTSWDKIDRNLFGDITHEFGNGWKGKVSVMRRGYSSDAKLFYIYGNQDPDTGEGLYSWPGAYLDESRETTVDANVSGSFQAFGLEQQIVLGGNFSQSRNQEWEAEAAADTGVALTEEQAFGGAYPYPDFGAYTLQADFKTKMYSAYGSLRLSPVQPLHVILGGNVTRAERNGTSYDTPYIFAKTKFLPFAGLTLDLTSSLSAYASYSTIFNPQVYMREDGSLLDPLEGKTYEAGIKGEWFSGKLNAAIAVYKTDQQNVAQSTGTLSTVTGQYAYTQADNSSKGFEFDVSGEPLPGLQLTGGYAYVDIEDADGNAARTFIPHHTARLSAVYTPQALPALRVGASARYQSRIHNDGAVQGEYAVVDLMARYKLTRNVSLGVNVDNVTNAKYWQSLEWSQGIYNAPTTWRGTLGVTF
ncbi:TonB-dependent siderophore receptor [Novosphingobium sp. 1949]|uniref:TonB-dependent siderophore receptor n=1 Tax=Novosphingobium organovorum TaxID=2930092 RepID=A0ABT0BHR6_9SPHN|nr:TonB-dependent siderophore receptor [Novosphingobium organovorum]MCJ2184616.1 TonB-dependent siderophore receptor [Novosphingobium organovorum]